MIISSMTDTIFAAALASFLVLSASAQPVETNTPALSQPASGSAVSAPGAPSPDEKEKATLEKHVKPILDALALDDAAKQAKVRQILATHFPALKVWRATNDARIKDLWKQFDQARKVQNQPKADGIIAQIDAVYATFKPQHDQFNASLAEVLTPAQVETVKDSLTANKVKVTFNAYGEIFHGLTADQNEFISKSLKAAREQAIDAESMAEKSAFFKKYKIQIEAYLTAQGYNVKQSYQDFVAKQKAEIAAKKKGSSPPAIQGPPLPVIPTNTFDIATNGAVGDGKTMNTAAIQKTIDAASAAGGGTVLIPAGRFLTGPLTLASQINLHLAAEAFLLISDDMANYPAGRGRYQDCISVSGAHDIEISGKGTIDGQGKAWWTAFRNDPSMTHRPYMIKLQNCERVLVHDVTLCNSPMFHLVPQNCVDVTIQGISIKSPADAPNTDGIDPSGWNFLITDCVIDGGDDNIAVKPGSRAPGNKHYRIANCKFLHGHGMSIGSGTEGGIEDLLVRDCNFDSTDSGIRIKTSRGRGGVLQNLTYENLTMTAVKNPIYIIDYYPEREAPKDPSTEKAEPVTDRTPINKNILIRNVTATNCPTAGTIRGLPEAPVTDLTLTNVTISAKTGMKIYHARGIRFADSKLNVESGKPLTTFDAEVTGLE
jgi:polygalacturonase